MIWIVVVLSGAALIYLERRWAEYVLDFLRITGDGSAILTAPGETVSWTCCTENHSRLPVPFVRLELRFPNELVPDHRDQWVRTHSHEGLQKWHVEERLTLGSRQSRSRKVTFVPSRRGFYTVGDCRVSAGDLLGFQEKSMEVPGGNLVVMPEAAKSAQSVTAVSGFLGDLSVRRFILEDPILTVGFRDYTGREPMKDVSWTRTAITGKLQVKQYDYTAEQTVTVLLNVEGGNEEELEGCFRLMRSVCQTLENKKIPFAMATNGNLPGPVSKLFHLSEGLGDQHLNTILYGLGRADYTCYHSFHHLVRKTLDRRQQSESYIVITPNPAGTLMPDIRLLETASGNPVCVLYGTWEVEQA